MSSHPLDDPQITSRLFYPRRAQQGTSTHPNAQDGLIPVSGDIALGYRYFPAPDAKRVILYFHGNGEVASDYDYVAPLYMAQKSAMLVVDYRGYGWSTGKPQTSTLLSDAEAALPVLADILKKDKDLPLYVMGRSLGSAPAIHLAYHASDRFAGLIVEAGFADMPSVIRHLQIPVDLTKISDMPVANARRIEEITLPTLIIHGEEDHLLPVENGQKLYDSSAALHKRLLRIPGAGHNDLLTRRSQHLYMDRMNQFFDNAEAV